MVMILNGVFYSSSKDFRKIKRDFFKELSRTFYAYVSSTQDIGYPDHVLNLFLQLKFKSPYVLDFEFDSVSFRRFELYGFSKDEWIRIYEMFAQVFKRNNELNPFIYLFFYDLIYTGPFGEDIEALDMSYELLALMGDDMLKLHKLFEDYSNKDDSSLVSKIVDGAKAKTVPAFVVIHLANWINEHVGDDKTELGDLIIDLYMAAIEKINKKPELASEDIDSIDAIRFEVDTSNFSDKQIEKFYTKIKK